MSPRREEPFQGRNSVSRCRSCRAPVVWAMTRLGRKMPIDAVPVEAGDFKFVDGVAVRIVFGEELDSAVDRFTSHFVTCPNAKQHRVRQP